MLGNGGKWGVTTGCCAVGGRGVWLVARFAEHSQEKGNYGGRARGVEESKGRGSVGRGEKEVENKRGKRKGRGRGAE